MKEIEDMRAAYSKMSFGSFANNHNTFKSTNPMGNEISQANNPNRLEEDFDDADFKDKWNNQFDHSSEVSFNDADYVNG